MSVVDTILKTVGYRTTDPSVIRSQDGALRWDVGAAAPPSKRRPLTGTLPRSTGLP